MTTPLDKKVGWGGGRTEEISAKQYGGLCSRALSEIKKLPL